MEYFVLIAAVVVFVIFIKKSNKGPTSSAPEFDSLKPEPVAQEAVTSPVVETKPEISAAKESITPAQTPSAAPAEAETAETVVSEGRKLTDVAGITARIATSLNAEGITSIAHLKRLSKKDLLEIKGVGKVTVEKILADI